MKIDVTPPAGLFAIDIDDYVGIDEIAPSTVNPFANFSSGMAGIMNAAVNVTSIDLPNVEMQMFDVNGWVNVENWHLTSKFVAVMNVWFIGL